MHIDARSRWSAELYLHLGAVVMKQDQLYRIGDHDLSSSVIDASSVTF